MSLRAPGHGTPAVKASKTSPQERVQSGIPPGRTPLGGTGSASTGNRDRALNLSAAAPKASGPSLHLDETIRRIQASWEATKPADKPAGDIASPAADAAMQRMKHVDHSSAASSHLGKRPSSGAFERTLERKRRARENGQDAPDRQESSTAIPSGNDLDASRRRSAPTAGMVNGAYADKPQNPAPVLRAVRSAPNKPLSPVLRSAAEPELKAPAVQVLEQTPSGRSYRAIMDAEGKMCSAMGALIPDGYEKYDDDENPWICPVRDCRRLFRNMAALGAHVGAKHHHRNLNDNGDGTLSIVGEFKAPAGQATAARVVSRNPLGPSEPPMADPKLPSYRRPLATDPDPSSPLAEIEKPRTSAPRRSSRAILVPADSAAISPKPTLNSDLGTYLRSVLPEKFDFSAFCISKEGPPMLQLTTKRHATTEWIQRLMALKNTAATPRCVLAFLLFLTGVPAEDPCPSCVTSDSGEECIVPGPSFPSFALERFAGSCAGCYYRCNRWHQKNLCLLYANGAPAPSATSQASSVVGMSTASNRAQEESGDSEEAERMSLDVADDDISRVEEPPTANGTSTSHGRQESSSLPRPQVAELRVGRKQRAATSGSLLNPGNLLPADVLEMEDWEVAPGTILNTSDEPDNIAFSNAYLFSNAAVPIMEGIGFNVVTLKPGGLHKFPAGESLRLCSLATGKLSVKMEQECGDAGFQIGPNGMFKVLPGTVASVRNRLYVDAVLHVTSVDM